MKIRTLPLALLFLSPAGLAQLPGQTDQYENLTHLLSEYRE